MTQLCIISLTPSELKIILLKYESVTHCFIDAELTENTVIET
jgi:hypothetical protein